MQKRIYQSLGGTRNYDDKICIAFGERVGWRESGMWLSYRDIIFETTAPEAHLPLRWGIADGWGALSFDSIGSSNWGWGMRMLSLFSRVETCGL